VSNFAGCANLDDASVFNGFAGNKDYPEKEQSTDSTATDVEKDFEGRVKELCGCDAWSRHDAFLLHAPMEHA
jgi:hypothetical protein